MGIGKSKISRKERQKQRETITRDAKVKVRQSLTCEPPNTENALVRVNDGRAKPEALALAQRVCLQQLNRGSQALVGPQANL